ncbi:hypothetical protein QBC41DRAFT_396379 [Cercophora samala]|uniref:Uncharacterized protein n=1 Tax=Cercophora samala TaxID=330535 RepID=A0AA40D9T6_9PEZI|nr:hypothetical protein QBC41DRAFT_396379 [Cercophora samala]
MGEPYKPSDVHSLLNDPKLPIYFPAKEENTLSPDHNRPLYHVGFTMVPPPPPTHNNNHRSSPRRSWRLLGHYTCRDLPAFVQSGFSWKDNLVPELCFHAATTAEYSKGVRWKYLQSWGIREFPGKSAQESRWTGNIAVLAHDVETLAGFRLEELTVGNVLCVTAYNPLGYLAFFYDREAPERNIDCIGVNNNNGDGRREKTGRSENKGPSAPRWILPRGQGIEKPGNTGGTEGLRWGWRFAIMLVVVCSGLGWWGY